MGFALEQKDTRKCSACGQATYRVISEHKTRTTGFAILSYEVTDIAKGTSVETDEVFSVIVYSCTHCNHLDLYGIADIEIPR